MFYSTFNHTPKLVYSYLTLYNIIIKRTVDCFIHIATQSFDLQRHNAYVFQILKLAVELLWGINESRSAIDWFLTLAQLARSLKVCFWSRSVFIWFHRRVWICCNQLIVSYTQLKQHYLTSSNCCNQLIVSYTQRKQHYLTSSICCNQLIISYTQGKQHYLRALICCNQLIARNHHYLRALICCNQLIVSYTQRRQKYWTALVCCNQLIASYTQRRHHCLKH